MIEVRKRPLLEHSVRLLSRPVPAELPEILGQLIVARDLVEALADEVRRLEPQQMKLR